MRDHSADHDRRSDPERDGFWVFKGPARDFYVCATVRARGVAVLAVLHDLNLAARYADRIAVLNAGSLVTLGEPWTVFTEELLSEVFEHPIAVREHPGHRRPLVIPLPKTGLNERSGSIGSSKKK